MSEKNLERMVIIVGWARRLAPFALILVGILIAWLCRHVKLGWS